MGKQLLIAGGSGLIGSAIQDLAMKQGWEVTILSRSEGVGHLVWDPAKEVISIVTPRTFDAIINLAGSSIAGGRWTDERKKDIVQSRIQASRTLEKYLQEGILSTSVYVGASAIGIYGDRGNERVDEQSPVYAKGDWMAETVVQWEEGHKRIEALGIKSIILRIGIVLSLKGGALPEMLKTGPVGVLGYFGYRRSVLAMDSHRRPGTPDVAGGLRYQDERHIPGGFPVTGHQQRDGYCGKSPIFAPSPGHTRSCFPFDTDARRNEADAVAELQWTSYPIDQGRI